LNFFIKNILTVGTRSKKIPYTRRHKSLLKGRKWRKKAGETIPYISLEMERRYLSNNQSRGRQGARTSSVSMPMRTWANSTPLRPPQQEERMEEEEVMKVMTDFSQIFQPTWIFLP
jgi:hypothetical protein